MQNIIHENAVIGEITYDSMDDIKVIANIAEPLDTNKAIENRIFNGTFNSIWLTLDMVDILFYEQGTIMRGFISSLNRAATVKNK